MFVVLLRFSENRGDAGQYMDDHKEWIKQGMSDGVFLVVGSLQPNRGGAVIAYNTTLSDLEARVNSDPFVANSVVEAEILEISPSQTDERLSFLVS